MDSAVSLKLFLAIEKCNDCGINPLELSAVKKFQKRNKTIFHYRQDFLLLFGIMFLALTSQLYDYFNRGECIFEIPPDFGKIFRPPEKCSFCHGITEVKRVSSVSPSAFEKDYAYTGKPVIVTDAMHNWTAPEVFDFWYFKDVYMNAKRKHKTLNCQFFPYKSGFGNFFDALSIPEERVNFEPGTEPWYFGWSNCNSEVAEILREHYSRPYFLPETSENNAIDWIFMGGSGLGAHMHVDNVRLPSWQAQLKGSKEWILAPPPECYFECNTFRTIVQKEEIIVLDTNKWYHQTNVQPGEMSITIGAEYD